MIKFLELSVIWRQSHALIFHAVSFQLMSLEVDYKDSE